MIPAVAVVAATPSTPIAPVSSAARSRARRQARFRAEGSSDANGEHRCPEHGAERRHARDHEDRDRDQRREVIAGAAASAPRPSEAARRSACVPSRRESASIIRKIER